MKNYIDYHMKGAFMGYGKISKKQQEILEYIKEEIFEIKTEEQENTTENVV